MKSNPPPGISNTEAIADLWNRFLDDVAKLEGLEKAADVVDESGLFGVAILVNAPGTLAMISNLDPDSAINLALTLVKAKEANKGSGTMIGGGTLQ
jgi:hypothetical protein